jgi:hypothetical protein
MTVTEERPVTITGPGVYDQVPERVYHADPIPGGSLSSSGARKLLAPSCPALFKHEQDHKQPHKKAFDLGRAAHEEVLGVGSGIEVVDAPDWRTKDAREARDAAYAAGKTPLLPGEYQQVREMADAIRRHPIASQVFKPGTGRAEQSLFWKDPDTKVICRARLDWIPEHAFTAGKDRKRLIVADLKSARSVAPRDLQKAVHEHGLHQQDDFYRRGCHALGIGDADTSFVFVFVAKVPPYLIQVVELDYEARRIGRDRNNRALEIYADCKRTGVWPSYSDGIEVLSLPAYAERQHDEEFI